MMNGTLSLDKAVYGWGQTIHMTYTAQLAGQSFPWYRGACFQDLDGDGHAEQVFAWDLELLVNDHDVPLNDPNDVFPFDPTKPAQGIATLYAITWKGHRIAGQTELASVTFDVTP